MKSCARCSLSKPATDFTKDTNRVDGLNVYCRSCTRERNRESYVRNRAAESERKRRSYQAERDRFLARNRAWREANREREREQHRDYYRANPEVFLRRGSNRKRAFAAIAKFSVTGRDLARSLLRHAGACAYCRVPFAAVGVTWDHVVPVTRGGSHGIGNLVPACQSCNSSKGARTVMEWRVA